MKLWKVWHYARKQNAIGKFYIERATVKALNKDEALRINRERLESKGYETAGGQADQLFPMEEKQRSI